MVTFLNESLEQINLKEINEYKFILPSKRAGLFLKQELMKQLDTTIISPEILSIEEFIEEVSGLTPINNTEVLFKFYNIYLKLTPKESVESFEVFCKWAQILLQDFNEIDRYNINNESIFNYLASVKELDHWSVNTNKTEMVTNYLQFWSFMNVYYQELKNELLDSNLGYQGLVYRRAKDCIDSYINQCQKTHLFLGFNALNSCEESIFNSFKASSKGIILWDLDQYFFKNKLHSSGKFLRQLYNKEILQKSDVLSLYNNYSTQKSITIIGTQKSVAQAKVVANILKDLSPETIKNTALVLSDENLLLPILNALPENITNCNITMGLPLQLAPIAYLFEKLFSLNRFSKQEIYFKDILEVLTNEFIQPIFSKNDITTILDKINSKNQVSYNLEALELLFPFEENQIRLLFSPWNSVSQALTQLKSIIALIKTHLKEQNNRQLDIEYLYKFDSVFNELISLQKRFNHLASIEALFQLYKELLASETLDIKGDPLNGIQIMGMLETRVLDYETVIITSVNEGILPAGKSNNSFIPFDLKVEYGLPTYNDKDAIYTYHFYHLLQRAKNAYILYNTEMDALNGGEKSRFITQLETENIHNIKHQIVSADIPTYSNELEVIKKTEAVQLKIKQLAQRGFSPSSLTNYIRNPIDFYYDKILGIREIDLVEETIAANTLGTIVHESLEYLYTGFLNKELNVDGLNKAKIKINDVVLKYFDEVYKNGDVTIGKNLIIFEVAKRYVHNFINYEINELKQGNSIKIIALEAKEEVSITIPGLDFPVTIKGTVDRIDEYNGKTRIIDYKTGKVTQDKVRVSDWEMMLEDFDKYSKPFQILTYAYMLQKKHKVALPLQAGIISFKNLGEGFLPFQEKNRLRIIRQCNYRKYFRKFH